MPQAYALAATLLLFAVAGVFYSAWRSADSYRIKGATGIEIFVKTDNKRVEKRLSQVYHPGEYIQLVYSCAHADKFVLLSIDERGKVSTYYPSEGDSSILLQKGRDIPLPNSILLDDYVGRELFVAVFSRDRLAVGSIRDKLRAAFENEQDLGMISLAVNRAEIKTVLITKERFAP
jgi:hypothetical protein